MLKRFVDIALVVASLPLVLPVCLVVAIAIKLDSEGPVIYWSPRVGKDNDTFMMPKFRSMIVGTPMVQAESFTDAHSYISRVGGFIRKTSLDELPQLFSVLKGDMSLVGPRPLLPIEKTILNARTAAGVHTLLPGISGWAQINGRTQISSADKIALDVYYLEHQSLALDLKIIALTILKVLRQDNIVH